jgi:ABC-type antimicrobial peptide transport system permease subunit
MCRRLRQPFAWLVVRDALFMIGCGTAIALLGSWALGRVVAGQLFGIVPIHAPTIALAALLLAIVLGAAMVPAWRASSVSPTEALHTEWARSNPVTRRCSCAHEIR